jgi:hypothetical protein
MCFDYISLRIVFAFSYCRELTPFLYRALSSLYETSLPGESGGASSTVTTSTSNHESPSPSQEGGGGGYSTSDKIALGTGIGVGLPGAIASIIIIWKCCFGRQDD